MESAVQLVKDLTKQLTLKDRLLSKIASLLGISKKDNKSKKKSVKKSVVKVKRHGGRPKGSKNKPKAVVPSANVVANGVTDSQKPPF